MNRTVIRTCTTARRRPWRTSSTIWTGAALQTRTSTREPLNLTARERRDLVAFLKALTGPEPKVTPPNLP
jgi:hypothetical protein